MQWCTAQVLAITAQAVIILFRCKWQHACQEQFELERTNISGTISVKADSVKTDVYGAFGPEASTADGEPR